jgi:tryptophan synthase alpha chain
VSARTGLPVQQRLTAARDAGRRLLLPYVTGGVTPDWLDQLRACVDAGADAVEIGLPFSDPILDGPTIQQASQRAIDSGATVAGILAQLATVRVDVPLIAMTYLNLVLQTGARDFCARLTAAGVTGLIVPDLPLEEADDLIAAAALEGVEVTLLASPVSSADRLREITAKSAGFVYGVTVMGTTGAREQLAEDSLRLGDQLRSVTDLPVVLGFGISTPQQAARATRHADGVVVASALMRRILDGAPPGEVGAQVALIRAALDTD